MEKKYKFSGGHWVQELKLIVIKKPSWWQKKWAKLTSAIFKVGKKVNNGLKIARRFINESIKVAGLFTLGVGNAHASNNLMGAGRGDASKFGKYKDIVQTGQTVGDLISLAQGTTEVITGATGNAVGVLLDGTGVLAVVGVPVNVASTAVAVHGTTVVGTATANIIMDYSGGGSGGGGSEGESSGEDDVASGGGDKKGNDNNNVPKGFKETKEFGRPHGQKVYKYKGKYYSRDIDSHNGGVWKVFEKSGRGLKRIGTADKDLNIFKR